MTVGIVGLGLIGGSIGLAFRQPGRRIIGYDPSPESCRVAVERQCVDQTVSLEEVGRAEIVFVASPPESLLDVLDALFAVKAPETVVTDCASVKGEAVAWAEARKERQFVPGHPMAGHERTGAAYASGWMFRGAKWIVTPLKFTDKTALAVAEKAIKDMGATPVRMDAHMHDRQVAILSHLPHAFAAILVTLGGNLERTDIAGGSWRDLTRVGGVDPELWTQIMAGNTGELTKALAESERMLAQIREALERGDRESVRAFMEAAAAAKSKQEPPQPPKRVLPKNRRKP